MTELRGGESSGEVPVPFIFYPVSPALSEKSLTEGNVSYEPEIHKDGWSMVIEARNGFVYLQNSGNQLYMSYSGDALPATVIQETLEVDNNDPSIGLLNYADAHREEALYYSQPLTEGGRVHILVNTSPLPGQRPRFIDSNGEMRSVSETGTELKNNIATDPFSFYYLASNAANADPEVIQRHRDKFILLSAIAADRLGGALTITTLFKPAAISPAYLTKEGYSTELRRGTPRLLQRGKDLVIRALKVDTAVILIPTNEQTMWTGMRKLPVDKNTTDAAVLAAAIRNDHLYF